MLGAGAGTDVLLQKKGNALPAFHHLTRQTIFPILRSIPGAGGKFIARGAASQSQARAQA